MTKKKKKNKFIQKFDATSTLPVAWVEDYDPDVDGHEGRYITIMDYVKGHIEVGFLVLLSVDCYPRTELGLGKVVFIENASGVGYEDLSDRLVTIQRITQLWDLDLLTSTQEEEPRKDTADFPVGEWHRLTWY